MFLPEDLATRSKTFADATTLVIASDLVDMRRLAAKAGALTNWIANNTPRKWEVLEPFLDSDGKMASFCRTLNNLLADLHHVTGNTLPLRSVSLTHFETYCRPLMNKRQWKAALFKPAVYFGRHDSKGIRNRTMPCYYPKPLHAYLFRREHLRVDNVHFFRAASLLWDIYWLTHMVGSVENLVSKARREVDSLGIHAMGGFIKLVNHCDVQHDQYGKVVR